MNLITQQALVAKNGCRKVLLSPWSRFSGCGNVKRTGSRIGTGSKRTLEPAWFLASYLVLMVSTLHDVAGFRVSLVLLLSEFDNDA